MLVYILHTVEYWRNWRGELGSLSGIQGVYSSVESAQKEMQRLRRGYMACGLYKDISDEPGRYTSLQFKSDGWPFFLAQITEQEVR